MRHRVDDPSQEKKENREITDDPGLRCGEKNCTVIKNRSMKMYKRKSFNQIRGNSIVRDLRTRIFVCICVFALVLTSVVPMSLVVSYAAGVSDTENIMSVSEKVGKTTYTNYITATLTGDDKVYQPGDTATFRLELYNGAQTKDLADKNVAGISGAVTIPDADLASELNAPSTVSLPKTKLGKQGGTVSQTFTVTIPENNSGGETYLNVKLTTSGGLDGFTSLMPVTLSVPFNIAPPAYVKVKNAQDGGSSLGVTPSSGDHIDAAFDLVNGLSENNDFTYTVKVFGADSKTGPYTDITSDAKDNMTWTGNGVTGLSGAGGTGTMTAKGTQTPVVSVALDDATKNYNFYKIVMTVQDDGKTSSKTCEFARVSPVDLSNYTFTVKDRVNGDHTSFTFYYDNNGKTASVTKSFKGTEWLDYLYYGKVADDPDAPFHNADEFAALLESTGSYEGAQAMLDRYIYDLFDPNAKDRNQPYYGATTTTGTWAKDSSGTKASPFHYSPTDTASSPLMKQMTTSLDENGVEYDEHYFENMSKKVSPDKGDANAEREYDINISADATPEGYEPSLYVFLVQTSWQLFDEAHVNADSIMTRIDEAAYLYDIKYSMIQFLEELKAKGADGNIAIAIGNYAHESSNSLVKTRVGSSSTYKYATSDLDKLIEALYGWDVYGDCEHPHWDHVKGKSTADIATLISSTTNIQSSIDGWKDIDGTTINAADINKNLVVIGGTVEQGGGDNGSGVSLAKGLTLSTFNHVYTISTISGTSTDGRNSEGKYICSWVDNDTNLGLVADNDGKHYVAGTRDKLVDALNDTLALGQKSSSTNYGKIDDATLSDTVTSEFEVESVTATWTSKSGTTKTAAWTPSGTSGSNEMEFNVVENADGTTKVTCNYGSLKGQGTVKMQIHVKAREDYFGSNNVLTNVDVPEITYDHKGTTITNDPFTDTPSANVPLLDLTAEGGEDEDAVGTTFNLKDYATVEPTMFTAYEQTNGTLKFEWVEVDENGNPLSNQTINYVPTTCKVENGQLGTVTLPDCGVTSDSPTTRHFKLKVTYTPDAATNGLIPVSGKTAYAPVDLTWVEPKIDITVDKVWSDGNENHPDDSAEVELYADGRATGQKLTLNSANSWTGTFKDLKQKNSSGMDIEYTVKEAAVPKYTATYSTSDDGKTITVTNTKDPLKEVNLTVTKKIIGAASSSSYPFTAEIVDGEGVIKAGTGYTVSSDGRTASFSLAKDNKVTLKVPAGTKIKLTETSHAGYRVVYEKGYTTVNDVDDSSGEKTDHATLTVSDTGSENIYVTVQNINDKMPEYDYNLSVPNHDATVHKQIDYLGDNDGTADSKNPDTVLDDNGIDGLKDLYRLYLDMQMDPEALDILFVIDQSNSMFGSSSTYIDMKDAAGNKITRQKALEYTLNGGDPTGGPAEGKGFVGQFLAANPNNKYAAIAFSGDCDVSGKYLLADWGRSGDTIDLWEKGTGTNYTAGLYAADKMLEKAPDDGNKKVVIFLSDGQVTEGYRDGNLQNGYRNFGGGTGIFGGNLIDAASTIVGLYDYLDYFRPVEGMDFETYKKEYFDYSDLYYVRTSAIELEQPVAYYLLDRNISIPGIDSDNIEITDETAFMSFYENKWKPAYDAYKAGDSTAINTLLDQYFGEEGPQHDLYKTTERAAEKLKDKHPGVPLCTIGFSGDLNKTFVDMNGTDRFTSEVLRYMASDSKLNSQGTYDHNPGYEGQFYYAEDAVSLLRSLRAFLSINDVELTDDLSEYVDAYGNSLELKVTMEDTDDSTAAPVVLYENGAITDSGEGVLAYVTLDQSTGQLKLRLDDDYQLMPSQKLTVSFNVEVNEDAFDKFSEDGYTDKGDEGTDYKDNKTSSKKDGFFSNTKAKVTWSTGDKADPEGGKVFPKPVVQVDMRAALQLKKIDSLRDLPLEGARFAIYDDSGSTKDEYDSGDKPVKVYSDNKLTTVFDFKDAVTGSSGILTFYGLEIGKQYWIVEEAAPSGYFQNKEPLSLKFNSSSEALYEGDTRSFSDKIFKITVGNTPVYKLPNAGGIGTYIFALFGSLIMVFAVLMVRKKFGEEDAHSMYR